MSMTAPDRKLLVNASDLASLIKTFVEGEIPDGWTAWHPRQYAEMVRIMGEPFGHVSWAVADRIVCAMGCPHVLVTGRVRVTKGEPVNTRTPKNGYLPAEPFQNWMREYAKAYPTLTAMYNDLDMPYVAAKNYNKPRTKYIPEALIVSALARAEVPVTDLYPKWKPK